MELTTDEQGLLLAAALGFVCVVALVHLGETVAIAVQLRAWLLLCGSGILLVVTLLFLAWQIGLHISDGLRFADVLTVFGGHLGLVVCLPSRWLLWRKCRWDRRRAQVAIERQASWWQQAPDPRQPSRFAHPLQADGRNAGVVPRVR